MRVIQNYGHHLVLHPKKMEDFMSKFKKLNNEHSDVMNRLQASGNKANMKENLLHYRVTFYALIALWIQTELQTILILKKKPNELTKNELNSINEKYLASARELY